MPTITTTDEPRSLRVTAALTAHLTAQAAEGAPLVEQTEADNLQDLLTDIIHFCDARGHDFDDLLNLAGMAHDEEQEGPSPLALPDPLLQPRS